MPYAAYNHVAKDSFDGSIEISEDQYREAIDALTGGLHVTIDGGFSIIPPPGPEPTPEAPEQDPVDRESMWRYDRLLVIARQLQAIEEDEADETPPDLLPGTRRQWLKYRGQVSNWNDTNPDFPDSAKRPVAPT